MADGHSVHVARRRGFDADLVVPGAGARVAAEFGVPAGWPVGFMGSLEHQSQSSHGDTRHVVDNAFVLTVHFQPGGSILSAFFMVVEYFLILERLLFGQTLTPHNVHAQQIPHSRFVQQSDPVL